MFKTTTPNTPVKQAPSWFQANEITLWSDPDLNPIENLWGDIKNAISEAKPRNAEELWYVVQHPICSQVPDTDVKQFSETMAIQLKC